jgi:hypothetical protein
MKTPSLADIGTLCRSGKEMGSKCSIAKFVVPANAGIHNPDR